jgi:YVTN family beta-propeller protein
MRNARRKALLTVAVLASTAVLLGGAIAPASAGGPAARDVLLVGNNTDGTVTVIDAQNWSNVDTINVIPDLAERLAAMTPAERIAYEIVKAQLGMDKFVDDIATSPDGRVMYVSRSQLADVVAIDIASGRQLWRTHVSGYRSDHMALSPDGTRLLVSATTVKRVDAIETSTGRIIGGFPAGDYPHENQYSPDGKLIYNGSIGVIPVPDALEGLKGSRVITIADAQTYEVKRVLPFDHGVRPFVITPDQKTAYIQLSFLSGFVEYDLTAGKILRTINLPLSDDAKKMKREDYPNDSAHHGLAMSGDGTKLCDAGTISDYVAILSRPALTVDHYVSTGDQPYWALTSSDGHNCIVTNSLSNTVSVISYDTGKEVARIPVGHYPQRVRTAKIVPVS